MSVTDLLPRCLLEIIKSIYMFADVSVDKVHRHCSRMTLISHLLCIHIHYLLLLVWIDVPGVLFFKFLIFIGIVHVIHVVHSVHFHLLSFILVHILSIILFLFFFFSILLFVHIFRLLINHLILKVLLICVLFVHCSHVLLLRHHLSLILLRHHVSS